MDFWNKALSFAEEAAKRSQELTKEAAKRSQELSIGSSKLADIVLETAKRSKEVAIEASKRADLIKAEAIKGADKIKSIAEGIAPSSSALGFTDSLMRMQQQVQYEEKDLETFGVTDELREFVKGITTNTFRDFPLEDDTEMCNVHTVSNVRQDLSDWQEKHANLVLLVVKEISKLRYELCPRVMKERKFWRIYFILVNSHVAPSEKRYMEELELKSAQQAKDDVVKEPQENGKVSKQELKESNKQKKTTSSSSEQDLDVFLLGDLGDSDDGLDDGEGGFHDDFDKIADSSDDEKNKL